MVLAEAPALLDHKPGLIRQEEYHSKSASDFDMAIPSNVETFISDQETLAVTGVGHSLGRARK